MTTLEALRLPISDQLTIPVYFNQAEEVVPPTLDDFGAEGCEVNNFLVPLKTPGNVHISFQVSNC